MENYDYVIVGSGFGGAVSALRLSEKGYKVLVLEKGKEFKSDDFPKTNWNLKRWLWMPQLGFKGIMRMSFYKHIGILSGAGVGGGSLVYANTLPRPKSTFFNSGSWAGLLDWENELEPFYSTAEKMLGVARNPKQFDSDIIIKSVAEKSGASSKFEPTNVGVFFGEPEKFVADPYFGGQGPDRSGCTHCGGCMTGCRFDAKNSLDKNYLHLAKRNGAIINPECKVVDIQDVEAGGGYVLKYKSSKKGDRGIKTVKSTGVVLSGGVLGTVELLLKLKKKSLQKLSEKVGDEVRTNNEALIFNISPDKNLDFSKGIAIGSIYDVDERTHVEPVRYGRGSGFWRIGMLPNVEQGNLAKRLMMVVAKFVSNPLKYFRVMTVGDFAKQSVVLLFMQQLDSKIRFKKGLLRLKTTVTDGQKPVAQIPLAYKIADDISNITGGKSMVFLTETLLNIPSTAHILGGAVMGDSPEKGVIDKHNKVFGYENLYVCDGSMISANPGVNPSLTITAITELAMSRIPIKDGY